MIEWIASTSGNMALRVRNMGLLQCRELLAGGAQRFLHLLRRGPAFHIMAFENGFQFQFLINIGIERRTLVA
jgi:hypothetical protein